jgi:hypothetical protein
MNVRQATIEASKSDGAQEAPRGLEKSTVWYALALVPALPRKRKAPPKRGSHGNARLKGVRTSKTYLGRRSRSTVVLGEWFREVQPTSSEDPSPGEVWGWSQRKAGRDVGTERPTSAANLRASQACVDRSVLEGPVRGAALSSAHRHCTPVRLSRGGCSCQFGRASAPTIPQRVQTIGGPNTCTGISSGHGAALMVARWWQCQHVTSSDRTPFARMLPSVIGSIGSLK